MPIQNLPDTLLEKDPGPILVRWSRARNQALPAACDRQEIRSAAPDDEATEPDGEISEATHRLVRLGFLDAEGDEPGAPTAPASLPGLLVQDLPSQDVPASETRAREEHTLSRNEPVDDVVRMWMRQVGRTPLLRMEDEVLLARHVDRGRLAARALHNRDREMAAGQRTVLLAIVERGHHAREQLTSANLRLVVAVAKRYVGRGLTFGDLIQEGNIGLLHAVEKFDYHRGYKFSTYATWWIRQSITRAIAVQGRTIRVPVHVVECMNRVLRAQNALSQALGREPSLEEVADRVGLSLERVREVCSVIPEPMSLETPLGDEDEAHLADFLIDEGADSPSEALSRNVMRDQLHAVMNDALSPREREVLSLRYGLQDGHARTLEEVGAAVGVTRERIRQIEARAMKKMRHPSRTCRLKDILD